jgi:hypothetical protein
MILLVGAISAVIEPVVQYVLSGILKSIDIATFFIGFILFFVILEMIPGDTDKHMAALSTFLYVLEVQKIFLTWKEAIACSNLFANNGYETWYPLTEIATLPRAERKAAIFYVARKTGRIIEPLNAKERNKEIAKKFVILSVACLVWMIFVGFGAARHGYSFDISGFLEMGVIPALAALIAFWIIKLAYGKSSLSTK